MIGERPRDATTLGRALPQGARAGESCGRGVESVEPSGCDLRDQLGQRSDARAVGVGTQIRFVEQHAAQAGASRAYHVHVIQSRPRGSSCPCWRRCAEARSRRSADQASRPLRPRNRARDRIDWSARAGPCAPAACRWHSIRPPAPGRARAAVPARGRHRAGRIPRDCSRCDIDGAVRAPRRSRRCGRCRRARARDRRRASRGSRRSFRQSPSSHRAAASRVDPRR